MKMELMKNRKPGFSEAADHPKQRNAPERFARRPAPPHPPAPPRRRNRMHLEFEEEDWNIFVKVFGDEDSASAAMQVIQNAPPEIGVLTMQITEMIRRGEKC